jgi:WD40 repeat protein
MNSNASNESPPPSIPDHEVLRCIGSGSFGFVWLARNRMGTYRAVKVVSRRAFDNPKPYERELAGIRRFEPVSRQHEGFVDILHVGINDAEQYFYYIMELGDDQIQGQTIDPNSYSPKTLAQEISLRGRLFLQECVQLGLGLSSALDELHSRDLVHRDIKPANIIFVHGVPKLADAGLVADVRDAPTYAGTKGFIPPEGPGTAQADIYSLGKVLYEAATGKDREEFPELPPLPVDPLETKRLLDLNEIILEACRNDTKLRYRSAWDMHSDLQLIADNVSVREVKVLRRRLARLKQVAVLSVLALLIGGGIGYLGYRDVQNRIDARRREIDANIIMANRALDTRDLATPGPYLVRALRLEKSADGAIANRLRLGSTLAGLPKLTHCWFPPVPIYDGEFSPDGKKVVMASYYGQTTVYDLSQEKLYGTSFGPSKGVYSAAFSEDDQQIVLASFDRTCTTWDATSLKELKTWLQPSILCDANFSPDGHLIVVAGGDTCARILEAATGKCEHTLRHAADVLFATFSHDGKNIVTASEDGTAQVWNATTGEPVGTPFRHAPNGMWVYHAAFSPDDTSVVTASFDHTAKVWDVGGRQRGPDLSHRLAVTSAEFSPDGRLILTASLDGTARLWRTRDFKPLDGNAVLLHGDPLNRAAFSPDGRLVLTTSQEGKSARIWDLAGSATRPAPVQAVFSRDGTRSLSITPNHTIEIRDAVSGTMLSSCADLGVPWQKAELTRNGHFVLGMFLAETNVEGSRSDMQVWNADTGEAAGPLIALSDKLSSAAVNEDGRRVVTFQDRAAQLWDTHSRTAVGDPLIHTARISQAVFSPDGKRLAIAGGNDVILRSGIDGKQIGDKMSHPVNVHHVCFSPDGAWLATCCQDDQVTKWYCQVWNATTGRAEGERLWHTDGVLFASFSPDSKRIVTAGEDGVAIIWDFRTGQQIGFTLEQGGQIQTAMFSPDGKWVVTASDNGTARVWDANTGYPLTPPLYHLSPLISAQFLADGRRIATRDRLGQSRVWKLFINDQSIDDLGRITRLLSGDTVNRPKPGDQAQESLQRIWQRLRSGHPSNFSTSQAEIEAWHAAQAEESEAENDWFAATFHLRILSTMRPTDLGVKSRLEQAEAMKTGHKSTQPEKSLP